MDFKNLTFYRQKINSTTGQTKDAYELLLRGGGPSNRRFPQAVYEQIITRHCAHSEYSKWLLETLRRLLDRHPQTHYALNLDHQELEYQETFAFLEALHDYHQQLSIEITETLPYHRKGAYYESINVDAFERIASMGYQIALDDIGQGMNSLGNLFAVKPYISRVKFSLVHFRTFLNQGELEALVLLFAQISASLEKEFVVEGIEDEETAKWLEDHQITLQQGYFYDCPRSIPQNSKVQEE